jgi:hypothetical protein
MASMDYGQIDHPLWEMEVEQGPEMMAPDGTMSHTEDLAHGGGVDPMAIAHAAVAALSGLHHDPSSALEGFEGHFGPGSTDGLRQVMFGGPEDESAPQTEGFLDDESDGMADEIPADGPRGKASVAVAGGEFIIPADVCSDLGSGNSAAGAKVLDELVSYVRQMRHGTSEQPPQVNGRELALGFLKHNGGGE